ncbi:phage holin family protein [Novosphingobium clariflavum]|uniref:Phage holin family protein n=1 Tax=Novosphingobium clariflavum TaxID=2029884 RepID=A0ABV6S5W8_9SPHN|nr:phage holin family protein [Novosphingobium clariflavum]
MEHFSLSDWLTSLGYGLLAGIAGGLGYVMRENDKGNPLNGWRALTEIASSGLVGFLVMLLCQAMKIDPLWTGFIVGIFGWLGANVSIRLLERIVYERLGIKLRANTDKRVEAAKAQEEDRL